MSMELLKVFDNRKYAKLALDCHEQYINAEPFNHIVFDDFLDPSLARLLGESFPKPKDVLNTEVKTHKNENVERSFIENVEFLPDPLRAFTAAAESRHFLLFLEALTGASALLPDPYLIGGGAMMTGPGGYLNIHADFNWHHKLQTWRRINVLLYLTPNWQSDWGGELELWSTDGKKKVKSVEPLFNRCVIFSTTSESYHGQPSKVACPDGTYRNVLSLFYYSTVKDSATLDDPHFTKYALENSPYSDSLLKNYKMKD